MRTNVASCVIETRATPRFDRGRGGRPVPVGSAPAPIVDPAPADDGHDLDRSAIDDAGTPPKAADDTRRDDALTDLDRRVLTLSAADGRDTIATARHPLAFWHPYGRRAAKRLSDHRLEALRCYAVQFRESGGMPTDKERAAVVAAGYTEEQVQSADRFVHRLQADQAAHLPASSRGGIVIAAIASIGICIWLGLAFEDGAIGLIVFGASAVTIASFFSNRAQ